MRTLNNKPILDIFSRKKSNPKAQEEKIKIVIDYREKNSMVASYLIKLGLEIEFKELKVGDYITKNTVIERKTISDFISSVINGRLLRQIEELKQFENKLLLIEGISEQEVYTDDEFGINSNAVRGFLLSVVLKHKIPMIFTKNAEDTAKFINILSKKKTKEIRLNPKKKTLNKKEQLQFIIEGFPGIGPKKAKELLKKFGTIQNIINSPLEDLKEVLGKKSETILELIERKY